MWLILVFNTQRLFIFTTQTFVNSKFWWIPWLNHPKRTTRLFTIFSQWTHKSQKLFANIAKIRLHEHPRLPAFKHGRRAVSGPGHNMKATSWWRDRKPYDSRPQEGNLLNKKLNGIILSEIAGLCFCMFLFGAPLHKQKAENLRSKQHECSPFFGFFFPRNLLGFRLSIFRLHVCWGVSQVATLPGTRNLKTWFAQDFSEKNLWNLYWRTLDHMSRKCSMKVHENPRLLWIFSFHLNLSYRIST